MSKYKHHSSLPVNFEGFINARCPQDVFTFFDDFMGCSWSLDADSVATVSTTASNAWDYTSVVDTGGSLACDDAGYAYKSELGGVLRLTTVGTTLTGHNIQVAGTQFLIDQDCGLPLYFECRFRVEDVENGYLFIGLSEVDTEIIDTGLDDGVGFLLQGNVLSCIQAQNNVELATDSGITPVDGTDGSNSGWIRAAFYFDGANDLSYFVDSNDDGEFDFITTVNVSTAIHYLPDTECLTPTIEFITGVTDIAEVADVDYVLCTQQRYHA